MENDLTAFQASQLQWLRSQVDRAQDDSLRKDAQNNAQHKLFYAREELRACLLAIYGRQAKIFDLKGKLFSPLPL